ncbi:MAG: S41 family peptidase [Sphingobium sp.]|nr:S41 family peptidase [Sphingobium sp.]
MKSSSPIFRCLAPIALVAVLGSCGGGGGGSGATGVTPTPTPTPTAGCSLVERQRWAEAQLREWYLFPDTLPASLSPAGYSTVQDYVDALTATARSQNKDRYFTYLTSIAEENAFYASGSSAGFGFRIALDSGSRRLFIIESFENTPALNAGMDRGTEILAIGTSPATLRNVSDIIASEGSAGLSNALGPSTAGTSRTFRIADASGSREVSVTKADYDIAPVSSRYGTKILDDGGRRVGYVNLRTFISTADGGLRSAFAQFRSAGVTDIIVDLRYNGGGLVSIAELFSDLLGGARSTRDVQSYTAFRPEKSAENETRLYAPQPQSVAATKIAFIGTGGTASASELVINAAIPYLHTNAALIGTNTYGKPVGQIPLDKAVCDDRLRVVAFATQNSARQGDYYNGLASKVEASCAAGDDISYPLGDPREASVRAALDFLAGRSCNRIASGEITGLSLRAGDGRREMLAVPRPNTAQREVPGTF